jgi:hypothetical protein
MHVMVVLFNSFKPTADDSFCRTNMRRNLCQKNHPSTVPADDRTILASQANETAPVDERYLSHAKAVRGCDTKISRLKNIKVFLNP